MTSLRAHPLREHGCELLTLALYRAERHADALATLRNTRKAASRGTGHRPECGPATVRTRHPHPRTGTGLSPAQLDADRIRRSTDRTRRMFGADHPRTRKAAHNLATALRRRTS